jgi:hypothetical protein
VADIATFEMDGREDSVDDDWGGCVRAEEEAAAEAGGLAAVMTPGTPGRTAVSSASADGGGELVEEAELGAVVGIDFERLVRL